ncbi:hypothetical protein GPECTOR_44g28 [Gonium pectorale]|uniref:Uncharacterized protein n=1 Tax=Gonium pectorale TaxID=33097 RepID=A0A150G913_GONPE|nr:hypothetical protein GPECTOR_44g28 [Gonium pectorale]|eukprot:KXZ46349.1 hypothetical protein GPECTOR_44g28 [Gonium pectorale]
MALSHLCIWEVGLEDVEDGEGVEGAKGAVGVKGVEDVRAAGREVLRGEGPAGVQALLSLVRSSGAGQGGCAVTPALRALASISAHAPLRPGLLAAGALDALTGFVVRGGGANAIVTAGGGGGRAAGAMELALLAMVPLPGGIMQLLLDVVALPVGHNTVAVVADPRVGGGGVAAPPPLPPAHRSHHREGEGGGVSTNCGPPLTAAAELVIEAAEVLADFAREPQGSLALLEAAGHLVLLQRLLTTVPPGPASCASLPASTRRMLDACLRGLTRVAVAAPGHPDLRAARTHEALLAVLLEFGLAERPGWWALQGLCALAADRTCASDLVAAGLLPPVVAALRGLAGAGLLRRGDSGGSGWSSRRQSHEMPPAAAAAEPLRRARPAAGSVLDAGSSGGGGGGLSRRDTEVAHLLGLLLQTMASHKALARAAVAEGAVQAVCEWLGHCVAAADVEGAVLCCATLCLLGDGDVGALVDMVHADGIALLVELLHPRWASAALVPSTVASAVAVACRWPASAQAVRMAAGIPALADLLRGPHGQACCRPVVNAFVDLIANDPPSLRDIRTTNTVIALGMQLQLLPDNDPRAANIRGLLRTLGETPDFAMRLANNEADNALALAAATYNAYAASASSGGAGGPFARASDGLADRSSAGSDRCGGLRQRWRPGAVAQGTDGGGGGSSPPVPPPPRLHGYNGAVRRTSGSGGSAGGGCSSLTAQDSGDLAGRNGQRPPSPLTSPLLHGLNGVAVPPSGSRFQSGSSWGPVSDSDADVRLSLSDGFAQPGTGTATRAGTGSGSGTHSGGGGAGGGGGGGPAIAQSRVRGESSYKSLRRASLKQLAKRMDASDFSDVEDDVEDYMALLHDCRRSGGGFVSSTLAAVNPLRLFGVGRRGARQAGANGGGGGGELPAAPSPSGPSYASRGHRRSLQVEGDELVYWSPGLES